MSALLPWVVADRDLLAAHLEAGTVHGAHDVDGACIYHYQLDNHERIAVALPGGQCILIAAPVPAVPQERRRPGSPKPA